MIHPRQTMPTDLHSNDDDIWDVLSPIAADADCGMLNGFIETSGCFCLSVTLGPNYEV